MMTVIRCLMMGLVLLGGSAAAEDHPHVAGTVRTCEPIKIEMCRGIGYNVTGMPNFMDHELQQDAERQLKTFTPLIQYKCSKRLRFFLCSAYVPMCTEQVAQVIGPCRPLCEDVRDRCLFVLMEFGFPWPPALNCSKFPIENKQDNMCMEGPEVDEDDKYLPLNPGHDFRTINVVKPAVIPYDDEGTKPITTTVNPDSFNYGMCRRYKRPESYYYINRTKSCASSCSAEIMFDENDRNIVELFVGVTAALCFTTTLLSVLTLTFSKGKIRFYDKNIIFIHFCYLMFSAGYLIRYSIGREGIACTPEAQWDNAKILVQTGIQKPSCYLVFTLTYFFGTAAVVWWLLLTITLFCVTSKKYTPEAIESKYTYIHVIAWLCPSILTVMVMVYRKVDADELTGMCFVGNQDTNALLNFVLVPSSMLILFGVSMLTMSMCKMYQTRHNRQPFMRCPIKTVKDSERQYGSLTRMCFFSWVYVIPAVCVLGCNIYEYIYRENWLSLENSHPKSGVFIVKAVFNFFGGIAGFLVMSGQIFARWKQIFTRRSRKQVAYYNKNGSRHLVNNTTQIRVKSKIGGETIV